MRHATSMTAVLRLPPPVQRELFRITLRDDLSAFVRKDCAERCANLKRF
jgi:hypothetical protein